MPISGIEQPEFIFIDETLRLRAYDGHHDFALDWYQDPTLVYLVDGIQQPYDKQKLSRMYHYLNTHGELYFIEYFQNETYVPIGDVTFSKSDLPIVIGQKAFQGRGIGKRVIETLIARARILGFDQLEVQDIYEDNIASRKMFEGLGFIATAKTVKGHRYALKLS